MVKMLIWLVVYLPLWKIWKSVGIIIPNICKNKKCSKPPTSNVWYVQTSPNQKKLSGWYLKFKTFKRKKAQRGMIPMTIMCSHPSAGLQAAPGLPLVSQHSGCQGWEKTGVETGWKSLILPWILPCFVEFACFTWIASPQKGCCIWSHEMPMARPVTAIQRYGSALFQRAALNGSGDAGDFLGIFQWAVLMIVFSMWSEIIQGSPTNKYQF